MHEDTLTDTADALGGGADRRRALTIFKDSRIGASGSAALTAALLLRVSRLARSGGAAPIALVLTQCPSRLFPVWLMAASPYVTEAEVGQEHCGRRSRTHAGPRGHDVGLSVVLAAVT